MRKFIQKFGQSCWLDQKKWIIHRATKPHHHFCSFSTKSIPDDFRNEKGKYQLVAFPTGPNPGMCPDLESKPATLCFARGAWVHTHLGHSRWFCRNWFPPPNKALIDLIGRVLVMSQMPFTNSGQRPSRILLQTALPTVIKILRKL